MRILLVTATKSEIEPSTQSFQFNNSVDDQLTSYTFKDLKIDLLVTGVGSPLMAYHMGKTLATNKYDIAFNLGVAGTFSSDLELGTVVLVKEDQFADLGAEDSDDFKTLTELNLMEENAFPFEGSKLVNPSKSDNSKITKLREVRGVTVNTVHGNEESINIFLKKFDAEVESMEGAAFLYGCLNSKISCFQIRSISNRIEPRNKKNWAVEKAIVNLNNTFIEILDEF